MYTDDVDIITSYTGSINTFADSIADAADNMTKYRFEVSIQKVALGRSIGP